MTDKKPEANGEASKLMYLGTPPYKLKDKKGRDVVSIYLDKVLLAQGMYPVSVSIVKVHGQSNTVKAQLGFEKFQNPTKRVMDALLAIKVNIADFTPEEKIQFVKAVTMGVMSKAPDGGKPKSVEIPLAKKKDSKAGDASLKN